ncbi:MAG: PIG-L deacetylase family protein [Candidatus Dormibacteria bacterium]
MAPADPTLPKVREVLAVCAHPDDESFGLGGVLRCFVNQGTHVSVVCLTHGEASTLGPARRPLAEVRSEELAAAARAIGVATVRLHDFPDGNLAGIPLKTLTARVNAEVRSSTMLLAFDEGGVTGHPDHIRATQAALAVGGIRQLPVLGWALPQQVATQLNAELNASFVGRSPEELDFAVLVDRERQRLAIGCHASQSGDNPILWRRLQLLGPTEHLRWLLPVQSDGTD